MLQFLTNEGLGRQLKRSQHELQVGAPPCKVFEYVYV